MKLCSNEGLLGTGRRSSLPPLPPSRQLTTLQSGAPLHEGHTVFLKQLLPSFLDVAFSAGLVYSGSLTKDEYTEAPGNEGNGNFDWVMANRRTADALKAKGYDYRFVYSYNSRHCDGNVYEHTLANTLIWMWRGHHD